MGLMGQGSPEGTRADYGGVTALPDGIVAQITIARVDDFGGAFNMASVHSLRRQTCQAGPTADCSATVATRAMSESVGSWRDTAKQNVEKVDHLAIWCVKTVARIVSSCESAAIPADAPASDGVETCAADALVRASVESG